MSIWIVLWFIVSSALIYFSAWTAIILLRQKKAWQDFAVSHKLRFEPATFMSPPKMSGGYEGFEIALFPSEHQTADSRGFRKLTAIEVNLKSRMPYEAAISSGGMVAVVQELSFPQEFRPEPKWWDPSIIVKTDNAAALELYLTPERLKALMTLSRVKNLWMIFIFRGPATILRIDTPDPLESRKKVEKILHIMLETARVLELADGEETRLKHAEKKIQARKAILPHDESDPETGGLQLEDE